MDATSSGETIYQADYIHPDGDRHERTANTLKMEATTYFDTAKSICQLDDTELQLINIIIKPESAYETSALTNYAA
jgi:hypothetical protein